MHDNTLTDDNRDKFSYIAGRYNQAIKFYNVEKNYADESNELKKSFANNPSAIEGYSIGAIFRLLIPKIFPKEIGKIIYLDADTVVNLDINELWQIPLGDKLLAAVTEVSNGNQFSPLFEVCKYGFVKPEDYFNSGVLVINIEKFGDNYKKILAGAKFIADNKYPYLDQDILNYCFTKDFIRLPAKFNYLVRESRAYGRTEIEGRICHYLGITLQTDMRDNFNRLWFKYFTKTPYFDGEVMVECFDAGIRQLNIDLKNFAVQMTALISGKSRAFFVYAPSVDFAKNVFQVKEDEEIILAENQESFTALVNSMRQSNGKKIFFVLIGNYNLIRDGLIKEGFVDGKDFLDGRIFLSDAHGMNLETHNLVKAL